MPVYLSVCRFVGLFGALSCALSGALAGSQPLKWGRIRGEDINFIKDQANQKGGTKAGSKKRKQASVEK
jgi:hypothetical protein